MEDCDCGTEKCATCDKCPTCEKCECKTGDAPTDTGDELQVNEEEPEM